MFDGFVSLQYIFFPFCLFVRLMMMMGPGRALSLILCISFGLPFINLTSHSVPSSTCPFHICFVLFFSLQLPRSLVVRAHGPFL